MWFSVMSCDQSPAINFKYIFAEARRRVGGMTQATLAGYMGYSEQQLAMQLADGGHPSLRRLAMAAKYTDPDTGKPDEDAKAVVAEIFDLLIEEWGLGDMHPLARVMVQALQANTAVVDVLGRLHMKMARVQIAEEITERPRRRA